MIKNKTYSDITIVVNSCDRYDDLWYPFFELLRIQWPECPYDIVLNTETKNYKHCKSFNSNGNNIKCFQFFKNTNVIWSKRLIKTLKKIDSEYVIMLLDDFFLQHPVDVPQIMQCVDYMDENKNICVFYFHPWGDIASEKYPGFEKLLNDNMWRLNTQAALWRKDMLLSLLDKTESPWAFEEVGSKRAQKSTYEFYSVTAEKWKNFESPIKYRIAPKWGYGVWHGRWLFNNKALFEKYNIEADFSRREHFKDVEAVEQEIERCLNRKPQKESKIKTIIKKILPNFLIRAIKKMR